MVFFPLYNWVMCGILAVDMGACQGGFIIPTTIISIGLTWKSTIHVWGVF
jgi:hypothetical protein